MTRARDNADLGDSFGVLGAGVTGGSGLTHLASNPTVTLGSNATFPAGHISNVFKFYESSNVLTTNSSTTPTIAFDALSWSATSGRHYIIHTSVSCRPYAHQGNTDQRWQRDYAWYGTTDRSAGGTTVDTVLSRDAMGRNMSAVSTIASHGYYTWSPVMFFTPGSTATHYFYVGISSPSTNMTARMYKTSDGGDKVVWGTTIFEVMP